MREILCLTFKSISTSNEDKNRLLIVGHNPTLEELVSKLTNKVVRLPTCTLIQIRLNIVNWNTVSLHSEFKPEIVEIWRPKKIELE